MANNGDFRNCVDSVGKQFGQMLEGNPDHMARVQPALFHRGARECRKADDVTSGIDVWNFGFKELIHSQPATRISRQPSSLQMKLIAIGLPADGIDESVSLHLLAALQFCKNTVVHWVDPDERHLFSQPKSDT